MAALPLRPVFISYRHENDDHRAKVLELAQALEARGFRVILDQLAQEREFNGGGPDEGWPRWSRVQASDPNNRILVVGSAGWFDAFNGNLPSGGGLGAAYEAGAIEQRIHNQKNRAVDIRIVSFQKLGEVPLTLQGYHRFVVPGDFPDLVCWLSGGRVRAMLASAASRVRIPGRVRVLVAMAGGVGVLLVALAVGRTRYVRSQLTTAKTMAYRGDRVAADKNLKEAKALFANEPELNLAQGWVARWSGNFDEALRFFSEAADPGARDAFSARARLGKVDVAIERQAAWEARTELDRIPDGILEGEDAAMLHFLRGKLAYQQSRDGDALQDLKRAEELYEGLGQSSRQHWAMLYRGATLAFSSDKAKARALCEAVIHNAKAQRDKRLLAAALLVRAELGRAENRYADSEVDLEHARESAESVGDTLAIARAWRATARLEDARDHNEEAVKAATTSIELAHRAGAPALEAAALTVRGHVRAEQKRWEDAAADQERALERYTEVHDVNGRGLALFELAELRRELKQYDAAEKRFDEALRSFPEGNRSTNNYANVLRGIGDLAIDRAKPGDKARLERAMDTLGDARLLYDKNSSALGLANVSLAEGEAWLKFPDGARALAAFEQAIQLYLKAGKERMGRADAHWGRARALLALDRKAAARDACNEAVALLEGTTRDDMAQRCRDLRPTL